MNKSVKITLVSDEFHHGQTQPTPPYQPKLLETGDGGLPNAENNDNGNDKFYLCICNNEYVQQLADWVEDIMFVISKLMFILVFFVHAYKIRRFYTLSALQDTGNNTAMTWNCSSSYAFTESDMFLLPDSPPPRSKNMDINPVEGVIRKAPQITIKTSARSLPINKPDRSLPINKSARYLLVLDSSVNITGIVDFESQRCYVMQLLRTSFEPHESLCDALLEMSTGYYSLENINKILSYFHMVKPAITNLYDYGMYISKHCADYPTFKMERDITTDSP